MIDVIEVFWQYMPFHSAIVGNICGCVIYEIAYRLLNHGDCWMLKKATLSDLRQVTKTVIENVKRGETVEIYHDGGAVAYIIGADEFNDHVRAALGPDRLVIDPRPWDGVVMPESGRVRKDGFITGDEMRRMGRALWGDAWITSMAALFGVSMSAVRTWAKREQKDGRFDRAEGRVPIPREHARKLKDHMAENGLDWKAF